MVHGDRPHWLAPVRWQTEAEVVAKLWGVSRRGPSPPGALVEMGALIATQGGPAGAQAVLIPKPLIHHGRLPYP